MKTMSHQIKNIDKEKIIQKDQIEILELSTMTEMKKSTADLSWQKAESSNLKIGQLRLYNLEMKGKMNSVSNGFSNKFYQTFMEEIYQFSEISSQDRSKRNTS